MPFCCLRRNVEASCLKHFVVVSHEKKTNSATYQRLVSSTCHGPAQLCVLYLAVEPFTARDGARYWRRTVIFAYPTCLRGFPSECVATFGVEKTRIMWLPDSEKNLKILLFVSTEYTNVTDRQTDRHCMTA